MKTQSRILFACFTGSALGAVVALQLHYFWWAGILVGGATGYLAYSFREVIQAALTAWNTRSGGRLTVRACKAALRKAAQVLAVLACILVGAASILILSIGGIMLSLAAPESPSNWRTVPAAPDSMPVPRVFWILSVVGVLMLAGILVVWIRRCRDRKQAWLTLLGCIAATPLVLPITLAVIFLKTIVPRGTRFVLRMARQTFILIHSEARLLCMTDALLGALIGYLCGNALVGGAIGAVLGWMNYRFISVRWLKLAKA